ncbi:hypothetical protein JHD49_09145 [Sulfurimonas sp. SAG-AH-194-C21]|nr:hypothetical protein [Sulfurimonas sp. SAG-AH-194-C21]MDF1884103.1 hypothetical protein [Sulfurimonas sp. SAG-AH-194-C21]
MQVAQYTFQSPSTSQVQVGKLDPSSVKEEKTVSAPVTNQTQIKAQNFAANQVQEVKPTVNATSIDIYA